MPQQDTWQGLFPWKQSLPNATISPTLVVERQRRQIETDVSTCGFLNGNVSEPRTADPGFDCRVDTHNTLWGFCPVTVISATDCGLAGSCIDSHSCSGGCGLSGITGITTFTCTDSGNDFCSTALLTAGPDQTYAYIACAAAAATDHLFAEPTSTSTTSQISRSSSTFPSRTTSSSTTLDPLNKSQVTTSMSSSIPSFQLSSSPLSSSTSASASSSLANAASSAHGNNNNNGYVGAIVGAVIGGIAIICFAAIAVAVILRRHNRSNTSGATTVVLHPDKHTLIDNSEYPIKRSKSEHYKLRSGYGPIELPTIGGVAELPS
ncbi:hypothetical protein BP6252_11885 [Coleophoma cylindrospora]|uniref:Uncharacterized protein n=1 Tax=Coleophoma cylindrospora TaxID=1849047 RepID=A0A3D8QKX8_9HELO|nr:hypothetical protein BP6252_11885 [Coleophoma cylindrospora]